MKDLLFRIFKNKAYWSERTNALRGQRWWVESSNGIHFVRSKFKVAKYFYNSDIKNAVLMAESLNRF